MPGLSAMTLASMATGATGRPMWPSDLTGLILWLQADQIQGIASGTSLSVWTDSSASASHATQPSAVSQPVFFTNIRNGISALSFGGGISQFMSSPTSTTDATTYCGVAAPNLNAASQRWVGGNAGNTRTNFSAAPGTVVMARGNNLTAASVATNTWASIIAMADPNSSNGTISVSGTITTGSITTSLAISTLLQIGTVNPSTGTWAGFCGELFVYNRNLNEGERASLESYMRTKWAI